VISGIVADPTRDQGTYDNSGLGTGYYALTVRLFDDHNGVGTPSLAWGWMEAVRIIDFTTSAQTTNREWNLLALTGGLRVNPDSDMQNPVDITLTPTPTGDITEGGSLSVAATCDPADPGAGQPGEYGYQWYLDGAPLTDGVDVTGATTATVSFPAGSTLLTVGNHNVSVLVTVGSTLSSETYGFTVVAP
jgi:hypothetical protein